MRKYFIAGVVAMVAFAMAAFAASLTVDGGTLQAGVDRDLTCTSDAATVSYATPNDTDGSMDFLVKTFTVTFDEEANCDGKQAELVVNDIPEQDTENGLENTNNISVELISNGESVHTVDTDQDGGFRPRAEDITDISVLVKDANGAAGYSDGFFGANF